MDTCLGELISGRPGRSFDKAGCLKTGVYIIVLYSFVIFSMSIPKVVVSRLYPFLETIGSEAVG